MASTKFTLDPGWRVLASDLGIDSKEVLKRAGLPGDLLVQNETRLDAVNYFKLWNALAETVNDPTLPHRVQTVRCANFLSLGFRRAKLVLPSISIVDRANTKAVADGHCSESG